MGLVKPEENKKQAAGNTGEDKKEAVSLNNETGKEKLPGPGDSQEKTGAFVYIGPPLETGLKENAVFTGTRENIEKHLKDTLEKYPQAGMLLVPVERLAKAKMQVKKEDTLFNKYYTDVLSLSKGTGRKEAGNTWATATGLM